ncbi:MAG: hypothetical protein KAJ01_02190 [Candidatus Hydrogenedentes bacterium]|nr:hypothetical protein [Candidatus Hydrogenedentota bacterium]
MVVGTFSKSQDPAFIEIIGHAGFDFVVLDLEHGPNTVLFGRRRSVHREILRDHSNLAGFQN